MNNIADRIWDLFVRGKKQMLKAFAPNREEAIQLSAQVVADVADGDRRR